MNSHTKVSLTSDVVYHLYNNASSPVFCGTTKIGDIPTLPWGESHMCIDTYFRFISLNVKISLKFICVACLNTDQYKQALINYELTK